MILGVHLTDFVAQALIVLAYYQLRRLEKALSDLASPVPTALGFCPWDGVRKQTADPGGQVPPASALSG